MTNEDAPVCGCRETYPQLIPGRLSHAPTCIEHELTAKLFESNRERALLYDALEGSLRSLVAEWRADAQRGRKLFEDGADTLDECADAIEALLDPDPDFDDDGKGRER